MKHSFAFIDPAHAAARELLQQPLAALCAAATTLRERVFGTRVSLCAIINAKSGNCGMDCRFCSQSGHYVAQIETFPMLTRTALLERITALAEYPIRHCGLVASGGALHAADLDVVREVLGAERVADRPLLCASLGRLGEAELAALRGAGLARYHHNLETSETYYPHICTTQTWQDRLATVKRAQAIGMEVCCGGLFGMGESWDDRIAFALRLKREGVREIPLNFLHPHPGTPLGNRPVLEVDEALRVIALFRHLLPEATLRICGGRAKVFGARQDEVFAAGANALMTGDYLTTKGQGVRDDLTMLERLGLTVTP